MSKKVKAIYNFIGTAEEVEKFGGNTPQHLKKFEAKLTDEDRKSFRGMITAGTELTVSDKRAHELQANNLVEVVGDADTEDSNLQGAQGDTNKHVGNVLSTEKVKTEQVTEKKTDAGPNKPKPKDEKK